ncbi:Scr1 family TA system antitoxin-like transcriptional regulator [Streptomyces sp. NPDC053542]|uniref:helix-turn-helix domain-containing protein n=1 Tax=Streptomyces sp. NPDC053542 TaxID=3365710 RepID=UPI0037D03C2B
MTDAWRYCGNQIKLWRNQAGVSREDLGREANYEYETVKSMELGRRRPSLRLLQVADDMCSARGLLLAAQSYLKPAPFPARADEFMALAADAAVMHSYEPLLIPGLLQDEPFARALISEACPPLDDETVDERVAARMRRQKALTERPRTVFGFVIYEAALRTLVGGPDVMRDQLHHLLEVGRLRNVSIQILPFGRCGGLALNGSVVLLETSEHDRYAYVEAQETSVLHADAERLSSLTQLHGMIRMQALTVEESAAFIEKVAKEL